MRVAIVGAGLAGLACAHELERLGILPVVYEKQGQVGKPQLIVETMAQFLHLTPRQQIFDYLQKELCLPVQPHGVVETMLLHGPREEARLTGHLAFTALRGPDDRSLERQLARHLVSPVRYNEQPDPWELRRQYDWVVVATGDHEWTRSLTGWQPDIEWAVRAVLVTGDFNPTWQHFFLNPRYAGTGYGMLSPLDERSAMVGIAVPNASDWELEQYWHAFTTGNRSMWEQEKPPLLLERLRMGIVKPCVVGNLMLVGQAGGFVEPLGITGQCPSLSSGVHAARQIALGDRSLERFARQFRSYYSKLWRIRRNVNGWTDTEMDRLIRTAHYGGSLLALSPFNLLAPAGFMLDALRMTDDNSPDLGHR